MQVAFLFPRVKPRRDEIPEDLLIQWSQSVGGAVSVVLELANSRASLCDELYARHEELIVVCGGTGLSADQFVPQCLAEVADYEVPGVGEHLRSLSAEKNPRALLGRGGCWIRGTTVMLAIPGGTRAIEEQLGMLVELVPDIVRAVRGKCRSRVEENEHD